MCTRFMKLITTETRNHCWGFSMWGKMGFLTFHPHNLTSLPIQYCSLMILPKFNHSDCNLKESIDDRFFKYYIILYKSMEEFEILIQFIYSAESLVVQTSGHRGGKQEETQKWRPRSYWPLMTCDVIGSALCKDFANLQWIPINKARMHVVLLSQC